MKLTRITGCQPVSSKAHGLVARDTTLAMIVGLIFCGSTLARESWPAPSEQTKKRLADEKVYEEQQWKKIEPLVMEWAKKGKPFIPWAAKPDDLPQADIPAFPGAEGGGKFSFGGRGGKVFVVTSLEDSGPGTLREALESAGPRIVVFNVAGIINLKNRIVVRAPYLTIAGQTAPGDGVCVAGNTVELEAHDIVVRYMRFRRGAMDVGDRNDGLGGNPVGNIIVDHCSCSWGFDENISMYRHMYSPPDGSKDLKLPTCNITIQWTISSEALDTFNHAFGGTWGGRNDTFHHDLFASNTGRNCSMGLGGDFNYVNNVVFNWRHRTVDGGDDTSKVNLINNYFKPGPITNASAPIGHRLIKADSRRGKNIAPQFGHFYVTGNIVDGNETVTKDNWAGGVQLADEGDKLNSDKSVDEFLKEIRVDQPFPMAPITIQSAQDAYESVLADAGATLPKRDPVDVRVIEEVRTGKPTYEKGIITDPKQVGGYPTYNGTPVADADKDGMPDTWEAKYGLNPNDASDAAKDLSGDGYTNIEKYLNGLDPTKKTDWKDPKNNVNTLKGGTLAASAK
jgi:pectate lyase